MSYHNFALLFYINLHATVWCLWMYIITKVSKNMLKYDNININRCSEHRNRLMEITDKHNSVDIYAMHIHNQPGVACTVHAINMTHICT